MTDTIIIRDDVLRRRVLDLIRSLDLKYPWEVTVKRHRKKRSLSQNALMWAWITRAAERVSMETGYEKDDIHAFFKRKFLTPEILTIGGETIERYSTTKLTTKEMSDYMEHIDRWCASELGILLPHPEDMQRAA